MLVRLIQGGYSPKEIIIYAIVMLFALTLSFSFHEFMHAFSAVKLGDPTPENMGRLTMNPSAHVDFMGALCMLLVGFGWGKPVVYNSSRLNKLKSRRLMVIMVNAAGVFGNFIVALVFTALQLIFIGIFGMGIFNNPALQAVNMLFSYTIEFSFMLLGFNLIPIAPLDGFNILNELLPVKVQYSEGYRKFVQYAPRVLFILIIVGYVTRINVVGLIIELITFPFRMLVALITSPLMFLFG